MFSLYLYGGAVQAEHVLVIVLHDLCPGGIDAERVVEAANLIEGELDGTSRGE